MRKTLLYILTSAAVLTSCSDEVADAPSPFLNGKEKTPLVATALLGVESAPQTRAADKAFDNGDQLVAYIRQVKWNGNTGDRTPISAQKSPSLITFTKGSTAMTAYSGDDITPIGTNTGLGLSGGNTNVASDLSVDGGLFWDDFSVNDPSKDNTDNSTYLRDENHYLQSYYGYCYNGGTPSTDLAEETGVLGWTVAADQSASNTTDTKAFQHSDLLWSAEQTPIAYSHATFNGGIAHGQLVLPYTHAMSKVTINLTARNGFADDFKFTATEVSLNNKNTVCTTTAPNLTLEASTDASTVKDIKMLGGTVETIKKRSYSAIIVPSTLTQDALFATITGVDGNKYEIKVTSAMLQKGKEHDGKGWGDKLTSNNTTQSGVHYVLDVTIDKQVITVSAALKDWDEVTAVGDGEIKFDNDITATGSIDIDFLKDNAFDVYKDASNASTSFATKSTTLTWDSGTAEWGYDPTIYWAGQSDASYFRALSPTNTTTEMSQGTDILWGYACDNEADKAKVGTAEEVKITPRTGDVPLHFEHPMSKISVILKNDKDASGNDIPTDARVTLTGAKISIINLYDKGTLNMADGSISSLTVSENAPFTINNHDVDGEYKWLNNIVIPQSLVKDNADADREVAPTYYQTGELTLIYEDETSLSTGGESGTYYLTSSLDIVTYEQGELTAIYADGTSIAPTDETDPSSETYVTSSLDHVTAQAAVKYTSEEVEEINAPHRILGVDNEGKNPGDVGYVSTWKQVADANGVNPGEDGYITTYEYPSDYTPITTDDVKVPAIPEHYKVNANSKKATNSTFKCYKTKVGSEQHNPGDLKSAGSKIMMYITLEDNTRYSIDLATCKAYTEDGEGNKAELDAITEWKRGEHYTYTISLAKEAVTFRAMIKDWDERKGGGNANLDWD